MEKVDRYVYAVTRRLPEKQRSDIEKELRSLIEDMLGARAGEGEVSNRDIEAVLTELGNPAELADQYREKKKYLIGPENFDLYVFVLKIVIAAVAFGITLALTIGYFVNPPQSLAEIAGGYFNALVTALFQGFAWVTVVFAIFEHYDFRPGKEFKDEEWSPADLPELPVREALIKPAEAIVGIIFAVLALILFNTADHLIGIYIFSEDTATRIIPLFNHVLFRSLLPLLNIMLVIGIIKEILKLIIGRWTLSLAVINAAFNLVSFALFAIFINSAGLINPEFAAFWVDLGLIPSDADLMALWSQAAKGLTIVVALALLIDTIVNFVKAVRSIVAA